MHFTVKTDALTEITAECAIVGIYEGSELGKAAKDFDAKSKGALKDAMKETGFKGKQGQMQLVLKVPNVAPTRVLLVGLGKRDQLDDIKLARAAQATAKYLRDTAIKSAVYTLHTEASDTTRGARDGVAALHYGFYKFEECRGKQYKKETPALKKILVAADKKDATAIRKAVKEGDAIGIGVKFTRDLGNLPGNYCTPSYLATEAKKMGRAYENLKVSVLDEKKMKELGMGSLLSVSKGSREPAKLIIFEYKGGKKNEAPHAIVGKGLTFDAGGISLKPGPGMDEMKYDMCGGASVFGTIKSLCEMGAKKNVIGVVPASENLPDGDANKPGDIVTSMSGQTIEILNTDAEGRLILCDALTYTERFKPASVIDIATLTGACVVALGSHATGLLGNDDGVINSLKTAADKSGDRVWQLPLWEEYDRQLDSPFADMQNIGGKEAGTITAGCFLARFTKKFKWAHLDVAGTAWNSGSSEKTATGRPVPLLVRYLLDA